MRVSLRWRGVCWLAVVWLFACESGTVVAGAPPAAPGTRRAVLIGIDDYSASRIPPQGTVSPQRGVRNLEGTVNDVKDIRATLLDRYGFAERDIVTLTDQEATREAIFRVIEQHLVQPARKGDVLLFYYSGHGSQVPNSLSDEPDHLDETIVPADMVRGADDIRDKELRPLFNQILDRGAALTVILDSCHSGSGARIPFAMTLSRGVQRVPVDIRDATSHGPRPEDRGALVLAAAQDNDLAWETQGPDGKAHGAFSLALVYAMRNPTEGESAEETFLRVRALLQAEKRFQEPVLAGTAVVRQAPLLGSRTGRTPERTAVAVERVEEDGTVILQGGWANGLTVGSELRLLDSGARLKITEMTDLTRCKARLVDAERRMTPGSLQQGMLAEVVTWAAPPGAPLRVYLPETSAAEPAVALAQRLAQEALRRGVRWVDDPTKESPTYTLRWQDQGWELLDPEGDVARLGPDVRAEAVFARLSVRPASLFVQIPAPTALLRGIVLGSGTEHSGVEPTRRPGEADYVLLGRLSGRDPEYAWVRSGAVPEDRRRTGLPLRSNWQPLGTGDAAGRFPEAGRLLEEDVLRLRKIHAWQHLGSPVGGSWGYELSVRNQNTGTPAGNGTPVLALETYIFSLRAKNPSLPARIESRYVYIFVVDSYGRSVLLYPLSGSVENRLPWPQGMPGELAAQGAPAEIPLGRTAGFRANKPYGVDTYFLLTTDEPLPNPWVLEWAGVRTRGPRGATALEELLSRTGGSTRAPDPILVSAGWSLDKRLIETVPSPTSGPTD